MSKWKDFLQKGEIKTWHNSRKIPASIENVVAKSKEKLKKFAQKGIKIAYQGAQLLSALKNNGIEINLIKIVQAEKAPRPLPLMKDTRDR